MFNKTKLNNQPTLDTAKLFELTTYLIQEKNHYIIFCTYNSYRHKEKKLLNIIGKNKYIVRVKQI